MDPTAQDTDWRTALFGATGIVKFSMHQHNRLVSTEFLAAIVLANRDNPWLSRDGYPAYLHFREAQMVLQDDEVVVYQVQLQPAALLYPSQLAAFTKYLARLAATAPKYLSRQGALIWSGSEASFGQNTLFCYNELTPTGV